MAIKPELFKAILAMDSYNRGYDAGIDLRIKDTNGNFIENSDTVYTVNNIINIIEIGNVKIATTLDAANQTVALDSSVLVDSNGNNLDQPIGFYGIAYSFPDGSTTISYRGTDGARDPLFGWGLGFGLSNAEQGNMAVDFYKAVEDNLNPNNPDYQNANDNKVGCYSTARKELRVA